MAKQVSTKSGADTESFFSKRKKSEWRTRNPQKLPDVLDTTDSEDVDGLGDEDSQKD